MLEFFNSQSQNLRRWLQVGCSVWLETIQLVAFLKYNIKKADRLACYTLFVREVKYIAEYTQCLKSQGFTARATQKSIYNGLTEI